MKNRKENELHSAGNRRVKTHKTHRQGHGFIHLLGKYILAHSVPDTAKVLGMQQETKYTQIHALMPLTCQQWGDVQLETFVKYLVC